jgi:hypothetical protein
MAVSITGSGWQIGHPRDPEYFRRETPPLRERKLE